MHSLTSLLSHRDGAPPPRAAAARRHGRPRVRGQRHRPRGTAVPEEAAAHEGGEETQGGQRHGAAQPLHCQEVLPAETRVSHSQEVLPAETGSTTC